MLPIEEQRRRWVADEVSRWYRTKRALTAKWHNVILQVIPTRDTNPLAFLGWTVRIGCVFCLIFAPLYVRYKNQGNIAEFDALIWVLGFTLGGCMLYIRVHERVFANSTFSKNYRHRRKKVSHRIAQCIRNIEQVAGLPDNPADQQAVKSDIDKLAVSIMEASATHMKAQLSDGWQTSVFVFTQASGSTMRALSRANPDTEFKGYVGDFSANETLLYHVALSGRKKIVPSCSPKWHPFLLPGEMRQRCKYVLPLIEHDEAANVQNCIGVLTIDCNRPFLFWSSRGRDLLWVLEPYMAFLKLMLTLHGDCHRIEIRDYETT